MASDVPQRIGMLTATPLTGEPVKTPKIAGIVINSRMLVVPPLFVTNVENTFEISGVVMIFLSKNAP